MLLHLAYPSTPSTLWHCTTPPKLKGKCWCTSTSRSTWWCIMPPPPCIRRAYRDSFALFQNAEEGRGEKGCTHIRRRRITHRKSHVWAKRKAGEKAREGPEKGSWYPPFGRDSIRGERQTATQRAATLLPSPLAPTRPRLLDLPPQLPQYRPSPTRFFYTYIHTHVHIGLCSITYPACFHPPRRPRHFRVESIENLIDGF